jgi:ADP-ribose pyrophosphatase YjhB (NUDIX family)
MTIPVFNNKMNKNIRIGINNGDGLVTENYWISRAPAVVGIIFFIVYGIPYVLTIVRSKRMMYEGGKRGVPSGFLDWNESGYDAMRREVYEETQLNLLDHENCCIFDNGNEPFYVQTDPNSSELQNVSLTYIKVYEESELPIGIEDFKCHETQSVKWTALSEIEFIPKEVWAFSNQKRIMDAWDFYQKQIKIKYALSHYI